MIKLLFKKDICFFIHKLSLFSILNQPQFSNRKTLNILRKKYTNSDRYHFSNWTIVEF